GIYADVLEPWKITVTRTGTNEITLTNSEGTFLSSDLTVKIDSKLTTQNTNETLNNYITNNSRVAFQMVETSSSSTLSLAISSDSGGDDFLGEKE
ncbi:MAG: hypothetical protein ACPGJS_13265, partial [Flammeovirgaceae bacterium]